MTDAETTDADVKEEPPAPPPPPRDGPDPKPPRPIVVMKVGTAAVISVAAAIVLFVIACALAWYISFLRTEHRIYTSGLARCYLIGTPRGKMLTGMETRTKTGEGKMQDRPFEGKAKKEKK